MIIFVSLLTTFKVRNIFGVARLLLEIGSSLNQNLVKFVQIPDILVTTIPLLRRI